MTILASASGPFLGQLIASRTPTFFHAYLVSLPRLLDDSVQNEIPEAYADLSDHTLPITDIACGFGPFPSCRVLTASTDHCVKVCAIFHIITPPPADGFRQVVGPLLEITSYYIPVSTRCHFHRMGRYGAPILCSIHRWVHSPSEPFPHTDR